MRGSGTVADALLGGSCRPLHHHRWRQHGDNRRGRLERGRRRRVHGRCRVLRLQCHPVACAGPSLASGRERSLPTFPPAWKPMVPSQTSPRRAASTTLTPAMRLRAASTNTTPPRACGMSMSCPTCPTAPSGSVPRAARQPSAWSSSIRTMRPSTLRGCVRRAPTATTSTSTSTSTSRRQRRAATTRSRTTGLTRREAPSRRPKSALTRWVAHQPNRIHQLRSRCTSRMTSAARQLTARRGSVWWRLQLPLQMRHVKMSLSVILWCNLWASRRPRRATRSAA